MEKLKYWSNIWKEVLLSRKRSLFASLLLATTIWVCHKSNEIYPPAENNILELVATPIGEIPLRVFLPLVGGMILIAAANRDQEEDD